MVTLIGNSGTVRFQGHTWWAQDGLLHSERDSDGDYKTHTVRDILMRLRAVNDMVGNSKKDREVQGADAIRSHAAYVEDMIGLCQKAQRQGMPEHPAAARQKVDALRSSRIVVPGMNATF